MSQAQPTEPTPSAPLRSGSGWRRALRPLLAIPTPVIFVFAAALAMLFLWRQGSLGIVADSLRTVSPWRILGVLAVYAGSIFVLGVRWDVLVRLAGGRPMWTASAEVFLTSVIVNYAAPIGLAVPTRAALTVRDLGLSPGQSGAVVGWELALDILALTIMSAAWLAFGGTALLAEIAIEPRLLLLGMVVVGLASLLAGWGVWRSPLAAKVAPVVQPILTAPRRNPRLALLAAGLTILFWGAQSAVMAALLGMLGVTPTLSLVLGVMSLPVLIGMLSPVPGGAGVREALMAGMARLENAPGAPVLLAAVMYRLALFVVTPLVWGGLRLARGRLHQR